MCTSFYLKFQTLHQCTRNYGTIIFHTTMLFCYVGSLCLWQHITCVLQAARIIICPIIYNYIKRILMCDKDGGMQLLDAVCENFNAVGNI
jgi:hypothetical protein